MWRIFLLILYNLKIILYDCLKMIMIFKILFFQALEYLFKFIVQSRILYSRATCGMEEEQFRTSIQELFQSIRFVLSLDSRSSETLIFTQVIYALYKTFQTCAQLYKKTEKQSQFLGRFHLKFLMQGFGVSGTSGMFRIQKIGWDYWEFSVVRNIET